MSVPGIESIAGFTPYAAPQVGGTDALGGAARASGPQGPQGPNKDFGDMVIDGIERLSATQQQSDALAVQAATGDLSNIHDYTIAATQAQVMTQVTVAVRNKALEAFTEMMRMPI
jgi:flagellar hook-basal body complex protein FliE